MRGVAGRWHHGPVLKDCAWDHGRECAAEMDGVRFAGLENQPEHAAVAAEPDVLPEEVERVAIAEDRLGGGAANAGNDLRYGRTTADTVRITDNHLTAL